MRIAHVTDCYLPRVGGIERQVAGLAAAQAARGHDVEIITSVPGESADGPVTVHRPVGAGESISYRSAWARRHLAARGGYDVIHVHASTFSPLAYASARAAAGSVPVALTLHSLWSYARPVFTGADSVLGWRSWPVAFSAVSNRAAAELRDVLDGAPVSVLANGVDPSAWQHRSTTPRDDNAVVAVSTMRLERRKRPFALLSMLAQARRQLGPARPLRAVVIGSGSLAGPVRDHIRRNGMQDWVELAGARSRDEIGDIYGRSDLYVSPARLESFGIAALEARTAGLPVIAFRDTGTADFVRHGRHGLLAGSHAGMVEAICSLAGSDLLRLRMTQTNRTESPAFDWPTVTDAADDLYRRAGELVGRDLGTLTLARSA